jgi:hypothetical protein
MLFFGVKVVLKSVKIIVMNSYLTILLFTFSFLQTGYSQMSFRADLRKKIIEKRLEISTEFENQNFDAIPFNYTIQSYYVLSSVEQEILALIQKDFVAFAEDYLAHSKYTTISRSSRYQYSVNSDVELERYQYSSSAGQDDWISWHLRKYLIENKEYYLELVRRSELPLFKQDFIEFFIEQLEYSFRWRNSSANIEKQLQMVYKSKYYVKSYPSSPYKKYVESYHKYFYEPGWFGMDLNFGVGSGTFTGEMGKFLSRMWGLELDLKSYLHSTFIGAKINATFNKSKTSNYINEAYIDENRRGLWLGFLDLYLGRRFDLFDAVYVLPHIGYSLSEFSIYWGGESWDTYYTWAPAYGLEINLAPVRKKDTHFSRFKRSLYQDMVYLRLNLMLNETGLEHIDPILDGRSIHVNLGVGIHFRATKRTQMF